jgi:cell division protein FtsB
MQNKDTAIKILTTNCSELSTDGLSEYLKELSVLAPVLATAYLNLEMALESANAEIENYKNVNNGLAGLIKGLQSENKRLTDAVSEINQALLDCHSENAKLRAALEFYSKDINWTEGMNYWEDFQITPCGNDLGAIAREALEKLK